MESNKNFSRLFRYDLWANLEALKALESTKNVPLKARQLLAHIAAAQVLWMDRIAQRSPRLAVWPDLSPEECRHWIEQMNSEWSALLQGSLTELQNEISYKNSKGQSWQSSVEDVLLH